MDSIGSKLTNTAYNYPTEINQTLQPKEIYVVSSRQVAINLDTVDQTQFVARETKPWLLSRVDYLKLLEAPLSSRA